MESDFSWEEYLFTIFPEKTESHRNTTTIGNEEFEIKHNNGL